jgi:Flp pilus assembly protein TadG
VNARGQAAIEMVFAGCLAGLVALAVVPLFQVWQARTHAERIADQAAVLVAEGRPLSARVKDGAEVSVDGGMISVAVPVELLGHGFRVTAEARVP